MQIPSWLKATLTWLAVLCALISAYYWYRASTAEVNHGNNGHEPGIELQYTDKRTGREIYVVATAMEQSRLNKIGAVFTAAAVLLQAFASAVP